MNERILPKKVLHLGYMGNDPWMLPVMNAINDGIKSGKVKGIKTTECLGNLSLSISRKLDFIPIIKYRLKKNTQILFDWVSKRDKNKDQYAYEIDEWLVHKILVDIDSFLFEINSCCELIKELVKNVAEYIGINGFVFESFIKNIAKEHKLNTDWYILLDSGRNYFIHNRAPFITVDVSNEPNYDLLIEKENLHEFNDPKKFIRFSEFDKIVQGFQNMKMLIQKKLIKMLKE